MGEVAEAEGGAAEVFESPVDGLGGAVAGAGAVEECEDVARPLLHGPAELADLDERRGNAAADRSDHLLHHRLRFLLVGLPVGRDDALVDAPGRLDLDVLLAREHCVQACPLPVGEQARPGVQGAAGFVERVALEPAVPGGVLLDPTPADIQRVAGEADHVERVHDGDGVGEFLGGSGLEPGEAVHRDHLDPLRPVRRAGGEPLLEHHLGAALDHVQQPRRPGLVPRGREVDDHGDVLVAQPRVSPDVLVDTDRGDPVEPGGVVDQAPLAFREDGGVRGTPGHPETCGDAGDGEVVDDDAPQRPLQAAAGDLRTRRRCPRHVLPPRAPAVSAPVPAHPHQQGRRPVPERLVRQSTRDRVPRHALDTALPTPRVVLDDAAFDRGPIRLDQLADGDEAELVEAAERGQVRDRESRVEHVEVFRDGEREELPSSGRPRPLPGHRRAQPTTPSFVKSHFRVRYSNFSVSLIFCVL